jgi:hypothetical protein
VRFNECAAQQPPPPALDNHTTLLAQLQPRRCPVTAVLALLNGG